MNGVLEVGRLEELPCPLVQVIALMKLEDFDAIGMGPGYVGVMRDRTSPEVTYKCLIHNDEMYDQLWPYDKDYNRIPMSEVTMIGFISEWGGFVIKQLM